VPKLDVGEGEALVKDVILLEVDVENVVEEGNKEEERVSNDDMEYNATVEC
jgi:hypothetical protein